MKKTLIKICGLTDVREVDYLKENNVDFAGMVLFYPKSKRNISVEQASGIIKVINGKKSTQVGTVAYDDLGQAVSVEDKEAVDRIRTVAVVVKPTLEQALEIEAAGFDYIQIHGEITEDILIGCKLPILKAFNVDDLDNYDYYLSFPNIVGFVFDAGEPGSGKTFDWDMLKTLKREPDKLYMLAGGINEENVVRAIEAVMPDGIDVSSGVEFTDKLGKDPEKINKLVHTIRKMR